MNWYNFTRTIDKHVVHDRLDYRLSPPHKDSLSVSMCGTGHTMSQTGRTSQGQCISKIVTLFPYVPLAREYSLFSN